MQPIAIILLKSVVTGALMLAYYSLVLRNRKLHMFNRFYLLGTVVASLVIPFLHFDWYMIKETTAPAAINMLQILSTGVEEEIATIPQQRSISWQAIAAAAYLVVSASLLVLLVLKITWVYRIKRKYKVTGMEGYDLIHTDLQKAPFSFLKNIFWNDGMDPDSDTGRQVLQHEHTHIKQWHTLDKLLMQLVLAVCWINPFYWYIQKELSLVHEFLADDKAIEDKDTSSFAQMLLASHYKGAYNVIVNPFFYSSIKRRIVMLNQTNKTRYTILRKAIALPLLLIPVLLFSFTVHNSTVAVNRAKTKITLILDAAHGGNDVGAIGTNGMKEKDLTRKVCNTIAQMAGEYNIEVVLIRKEDDYPSLAQRVEMANAINEGVFVSIHVNKSSPEYVDKNGVKVLANIAVDGYEIIVSGKNVKITESKKLALAVVSQFKMASMSPQLTLTEKGIFILKENHHPAIAIECGNIDNAVNVARLQDDKQREAMCRYLLSGVVAYGNAQK